MNFPSASQPNGGMPMTSGNEHDRKKVNFTWGDTFRPQPGGGQACSSAHAPQGSWEHNVAVPRPSMPDPRVTQYPPRWTQADAPTQEQMREAMVGKRR